MRTIALRFAETFAPECGTIAAHQHMIDRHGFVWYGKLGNPVSLRVATDMLKQEDHRFLLIHSGGSDRYWMHVESIRREVPELESVDHE